MHVGVCAWRKEGGRERRYANREWVTHTCCNVFGRLMQEDQAREYIQAQNE